MAKSWWDLTTKKAKALRMLSPIPQLSKHRRSLTVTRIRSLSKTLPRKFDYLEIGVEKGETFEAITGAFRVGVDPFPLFDDSKLPMGTAFHRVTSDEFFSSPDGMKFDLVFVDGLHTAEQTYNDILNSLSTLRAGGFLLVDDIWPSDFPSSLASQEAAEAEKEKAGISHRRWYGDTFKVIPLLLAKHPEVRIRVIGDGQDAHAQALMWLDTGRIVGKKFRGARGFFESFDYSDIFENEFLPAPFSECLTDYRFLKARNSKELLAIIGRR